MTGQIDGNDCVLRLQWFDLLLPIIGIGGPTVYEDDCGIAFAIYTVFNVHAVGLRSNPG